MGKKTGAMIFAMACNCLDEHQLTAGSGFPDQAIEPCGTCKSCWKIQSGNHPDIILVEPAGPIIKIAQIRGLCNTLALKPYEARLRVVIISGAQAMNPEASNALLKMLEEPPDRTVLILTALETSGLLPTIVSRCQHIRFNPISLQTLAAMLVEKQGLAPEEAIIMGFMAQGSYAKALSLVGSTNRINWLNRRNWLIKSIGLDNPQFMSSRPIGLLMAFAARLSQNKDALFDSLEIVKSYLRDLVVYKYYPEKVVNRDLTDTIQNASKKISVKSLLSKIKDIQSAQKDIKANANIRLTLEVLILRLTDAGFGINEKGSWNKI